MFMFGGKSSEVETRVIRAKMDIINFTKTIVGLEELRNAFKCALCTITLLPDEFLFSNGCSHFFCTGCLCKNYKCPIDDSSYQTFDYLSTDRELYDFYVRLTNLDLCKFKNIDLKMKNAPVQANLETDEIIKTRRSSSRRHSVRLEQISSSISSSLEKKDTSSELSEESILKQDETPSKRSRRSGPVNSDNSSECDLVKQETFIKPRRESIRNRSKTIQELRTPEKSDVQVKKVKSTPRNRRQSTKNINRRNAKGETPLHLACKKGDIEVINALINDGADINAKDNAGWTPLHDSVVQGDKHVVEVLLKLGAKVNIPGLENMTPLHQTVVEKNIDIMMLLLQHGASISIRNIYGQTPLDLAELGYNKEIQEMLQNKEQNEVKEDGMIEANLGLEHDTNSTQDIVILPSNLDKQQLKILKELQKDCHFDIVPNFMAKSQITHLLLRDDEKLVIDINLLFAVVQACSVVSFNWIEECKSQGTLISSADFELNKKHEDLKGLIVSRGNMFNRLPGLFSGCHFYLGSCFENYQLNNVVYKRADVMNLIEKCEGKILKRCPDPESLTLESTVPFHADISGPLANCSYFIIYQTGKWDPVIKYNMKHVKTLPFDWLITSVLNFKLIDPTEM